MSVEQRQKQFEDYIKGLPFVGKHDSRVIPNFGFSNSARVLEGGLFACTSNLEDHTERVLADGKASARVILLCVLTFPPHDEVYFAIVIEKDIDRLNSGLLKLAQARTVELSSANKTKGKINNNVRFNVVDGGEVYFENDFRTALIKKELDPDLLATIDSIEFAIWPPAVSAHRSLLARQFVGYLGSLIGKERVHELNVWPDASALNPDMRRLPHTLDVDEIEVSVRTLGGFYPGGEVRRYHGALNYLSSKHFVILSGLSGTGKTRLALQYARAVHGIISMGTADPLLYVCPVRPEWTDPTGLTGYFDVLSNRYVVPRFLEAVLVATAHGDAPVFVVLDEMNLARVEHYFSDILSSIETGEDLQLHSSGVPIEGTTGTSIPAALPLPRNLYITGTINVDETTNPVSDKVLDRAAVIDMSKVDLGGFLKGLEDRFPELKNARAASEPVLLDVHAKLLPHGLGFGYRVAEEVVRYHAFAATSLGMTPAEIIDQLMVQKVLVKLRGSDRQRAMLNALEKSLAGMPQSLALLARLTADLDEFGSFQAAR